MATNKVPEKITPIPKIPSSPWRERVSPVPSKDIRGDSAGDAESRAVSVQFVLEEKNVPRRRNVEKPKQYQVRMRLSQTAFEGRNLKWYAKLRKYTESCLMLSGMHGTSHFAERRVWWEKLIWTLVMLGCMAFGIFCIVMVCMKWIKSPTIVSFARKERSITDIPFPAITICPEVKTLQYKFSYGKVLDKLHADIELTEEE